MVDPFGEISFLTRSENRVAVLTTLADAAHTERELVETTGISDVTVRRVLEDFDDRGWVVERAGKYRATKEGELLATDYRRLEQSMAVAARIGPVREFLPVEEIDFDLRHLVGGRISDPDSFDSLRAVDRWGQLLEQSDRVVGTAPAPTATTVVAEPFHEAVTEEGLTFRAVLSEAYYERATSRPEMRTLLREILRADAKFYLAPEPRDFTANVALFDDLATITGYDENGNLRVGIESQVEPVREWVRETYDSYREDARPLGPEDFDE